MAPMLIIDDDIISKGNPYIYNTLTERELNTRNAMFVLTITLPIAGAAFAVIYHRYVRNHPRNSELPPTSPVKMNSNAKKKGPIWWTWPRLAAMWFISVGVFGTLVHLEMGRTERITFILACAHVQLEMLMQAYLLNVRPVPALAFTWFAGFIMHAVVLLAPSMTWVFLTAATVGGTGDFALVAIFFHAKKWLFTLGALGHLASAVGIFTASIWTWDVIGFNAIIYFAMWGYIGFSVAAVVQHEKKKLGGSRGAGGPAIVVSQPTTPEGQETETDPLLLRPNTLSHTRNNLTDITLRNTPPMSTTDLPADGGSLPKLNGNDGTARQRSKRPDTASSSSGSERASLLGTTPENSTELPSPVTSPSDDKYISPGNPVGDVKFTKKVLVRIYLMAFVGALTTSLILAFGLPWELPRGMPKEELEKIGHQMVDVVEALVINSQ